MSQDEEYTIEHLAKQAAFHAKKYFACAELLKRKLDKLSCGSIDIAPSDYSDWKFIREQAAKSEQHHARW